MAIILGIDAAWTKRQPSGVALLDTDRAAGQCLLAAPSYAAFLEQAAGHDVDWLARHEGGEAPVEELLIAVRQVAGRSADLVTVDMPVSTEPVTGRRVADQRVSEEFGGRWCAAHSPGVERPGALGKRLGDAFAQRGYAIATAQTPAGTPLRLVEVYPHPALLALLQCERRIPYKFSKSAKYWPGESPARRAALVIEYLHAIEAALTEELGDLPFTLPRLSGQVPARVWKGYEDALDAVVAAWVGSLYWERRASPLGDGSAAVWCPRSVIRTSG